MAAFLQWGVVIGASLLAAVSDVRTRRIPNALTGPLWVAGLIWATWQGGWMGLGQGFGASVTLAAPFVLLFLFGNGGAGDAKLMAGLGAWLGLREGMIVLFFVCGAGLILGLAKAIMHGRVRQVLGNIYASVYTFIVLVMSGRTKKYIADYAGRAEKAQAGYDLTMPYALAILAGVCAAGAYLWLR